MSQEEATKNLKQLFEDFFEKVDDLSQEHDQKIQSILQEIEEMKLNEIRDKLKDL